MSTPKIELWKFGNVAIVSLKFGLTTEKIAHGFSQSQAIAAAKQYLLDALSELDAMAKSEVVDVPKPPTKPKPKIAELGQGWRLLNEGEPLQPGDGVLHPAYPEYWIDYECRPEMFRGNKQFAHKWPWRRKIAQTVEPGDLKDKTHANT